MSEKTNQDRIKKYLVGYEKDGKHKKGYLEKDISNGKVIMLSGKWGSGKTHFWQKKIIPSLNEEESKIPNHYISLYGKTSIEEIKSEIFLKVFESVDSFKSEEKVKKIVKNSVDLVSSLTKTVSVFGLSLDLSKVTDKSFEKIDNLLNDEKLKRTEEYLNSGAIICFDDFERKSKDIDLNDLFGFITQLTLNFKCKVVIILNDDVFEGEEKAIFTNVKEKTVSKFLKYEPSIDELFKSIFDNDEEYRKLDEYKEIILKTIEETEELNARIYFQVLDNLIEWIDKKQEDSDDTLRCLILVNINFILYHTVLIRELKNQGGNEFYLLKIKELLLGDFNYFNNLITSVGYRECNSFENYITIIKNKRNSSKDLSDERIRINNKFLEDNLTLFRSDYFANKLFISNGINDEMFKKINNFIETGILINE